MSTYYIIVLETCGNKVDPGNAYIGIASITGEIGGIFRNTCGIFKRHLLF